jgi:HEAT repeat protein
MNSERQSRPVSGDIIAELTRQVRACAGAPRSPECRALVREALQSKWEGVQSVAIQTLGAWGDPDSRSLLRETIERLDEREHGWSIRGVAVRALAACISEDDADWALDRLFALDGVLAKHDFLPVVLALPLDSARGRLLAEASSPCRDDRQAAMKALGNMDLPDRDQVLSSFLDDDDEQIRCGARLLLARDETLADT